MISFGEPSSIPGEMFDIAFIFHVCVSSVYPIVASSLSHDTDVPTIQRQFSGAVFMRYIGSTEGAMTYSRTINRQRAI